MSILVDNHDLVERLADRKFAGQTQLLTEALSGDGSQQVGKTRSVILGRPFQIYAKTFCWR